MLPKMKAKSSNGSGATKMYLQLTYSIATPPINGPAPIADIVLQVNNINAVARRSIGNACTIEK